MSSRQSIQISADPKGAGNPALYSVLDARVAQTEVVVTEVAETAAETIAGRKELMDKLVIQGVGRDRRFGRKKCRLADLMCGFAQCRAGAFA